MEKLLEAGQIDAAAAEALALHRQYPDRAQPLMAAIVGPLQQGIEQLRDQADPAGRASLQRTYLAFAEAMVAAGDGADRSKREPAGDGPQGTLLP